MRLRENGQNVKATDSRVWLMARRISNKAKKNGIPAKNYLKDANEKAFNKHISLLEMGLFKDIEQSTRSIVGQLEKNGINTR